MNERDPRIKEREEGQGHDDGHYEQPRDAAPVSVVEVDALETPAAEEGEAGERSLSDLLRGPINIRSLALTAIAVLALLYTIVFARSFLLPIVLALLLKFLFDPVVRFLNRWFSLPNPLGAALVIAVVIAGFGYAIYALSGPAASWLEKLPQGIEKIEPQIERVQRELEGLWRVTEEVEDLTGGTSEEGRVQVAAVESPGWTGVVLTMTQEFIAGAVVLFILLYFLLASGDHFLRKLVKVSPELSDKKRVVEVVRQVQSDISVYLFTITLINAGLGLAVGTAMFLLGVPNPVLWGVVAGLLNFIPYIGALVGVAIILLVSLLSFQSLSEILLPPLVYYVLNFLEGNFFTPFVLGFRLTLSPVAILLSLIFWLWVWGIAGALLAVPILAALKIVCDRFEGLQAIGELLGR